MKQLVLHIGTHKTGTTALQEFMQRNAERLEELGICVPSTPSKYTNVNRDRNGYFLDIATKKTFKSNYWRPECEPLIVQDMDVVKQAVEQHDRVYLSDERIWYEAAQYPRYWEVFEDLAKQCGFDDFRFVVYLRRQDIFVASLWSQFVKRREDATLEEYLERKSVRNAIDYLANLRRIDECFGPGRVTVRVYERERLVGRDICQDFCDAIGIEWQDDFVLPGGRNPSLTRNLAEIKRVVNSTNAFDESDNFLKQVAYDASAASKERPSSPFSAEVREALLGYYAEGNQVIAREYLGKEDGVLFGAVATDQVEWSAVTPQMVTDICYFFAEALSIEHARVRELEREVARLSAINRNSLFMKIERRLRGRSKMEA